MSRYNFYYDESEHSRKINYTTVSASNYYDNFITGAISSMERKNLYIKTGYGDKK